MRIDRVVLKSLIPFITKKPDYMILVPHRPELMSPDNTIISFDLHDVIFKKSPSQIFRELLKIKRKGRLVRLALNPYFWADIKRLKRQTQVAEDLFNRLILKYPQLSDLEPEFIRISNAQKPKRNMISLLKRLHDAGYELYVLSNIAERTFAQLTEKYPTIFQYFKGACVVSASDNYLQKPELAYYEKFKQYLAHEHSQADKHILFIDDLQQNISAAGCAGMSGIQFKNAKNLQHVLKRLQIL